MDKHKYEMEVSPAMHKGQNKQVEKIELIGIWSASFILAAFLIAGQIIK